MVKEWKKRLVSEIRKTIEESDLIAIIDMYKTPTREFQEMKKILNDVKFKFIKKSLLLKALEGIKKENIEAIKDFLPSQILLAINGKDPFSFFKKLMKVSVYRFGKEGDIAEDDIVISAGPTKLPAGPAISDFAKAKIPAGVEGGKIAVKKDTLLVKKGEKIPENLISLLRKLEIRPIKVKLNVVAIYHLGKIYTKEDLEMVFKYPYEIKRAYMYAFNLTINIGYPTKENIKYLLIKAYNEANALKSKTEVKK